MTDPLAADALAYYVSLIEQRYPPDLAVALAQARYARGLGAADLPLPAVLDAVEALARGNATVARHASAIRSHLEAAVSQPTRGRRAS